MKKTILIMGLIAMLGVVSCGPSAKELEEKRISDSIHLADSCKKIDSINTAFIDSVNKAKIADSLKNIKVKK
jgi:hypothetical protein